MEEKISILAPFFENPGRTFHKREIAKLARISHTAARVHMERMAKEGYLAIRPTRPYKTYQANTASRKYLNLKLYYNLEKIRESGLAERLEHHYNFPVIVLFGSYAKAADDEKSDIDICIISPIREIPEMEEFEKIVRRPVSIHLFSASRWREMKEKNPGMINSICNGIVLSGQLEVA